MTQTVTLPNGDEIDFPDGMPQDALNAAVSRHMAANGGATVSPAAGNEPSIAARANIPPTQPQLDPIVAEQQRRFQAMNPTGGLMPGPPTQNSPLIPMLPQPVRDFAGLGFNEASMDASSALREQAPAERARLGPVASGVAETLGYYASPTTWLNAVPGVGGALAGGLHEGIKSRFEGDDWTTAGKKTVEGGATGLASTGIANVLTKPSVLSKIVELSGMGAAGSIGHFLFGGSPTATFMGALIGDRAVQPAVKWVEENSGSVARTLRPYVAAGLQGTASAVQPKQGWRQWWTGQ